MLKPNGPNSVSNIDFTFPMIMLLISDIASRTSRFTDVVSIINIADVICIAKSELQYTLPGVIKSSTYWDSTHYLSTPARPEQPLTRRTARFANCNRHPTVGMNVHHLRRAANLSQRGDARDRRAASSRGRASLMSFAAGPPYGQSRICSKRTRESLVATLRIASLSMAT